MSDLKVNYVMSLFQDRAVIPPCEHPKLGSGPGNGHSPRVSWTCPMFTWPPSQFLFPLQRVLKVKMETIFLRLLYLQCSGWKAVLNAFAWDLTADLRQGGFSSLLSAVSVPHTLETSFSAAASRTQLPAGLGKQQQRWGRGPWAWFLIPWCALGVPFLRPWGVCSGQQW